MLDPLTILKAAGDVEDPAERLNRLVDQQEARIANIFRTAISELKGELDLEKLATELEQGRVNAALDRLKFAADSLGAASNVAFVTSGQSTADFLTNAGVGRILFDQVNLNAVAMMQASRLDLIREFTAEQLRATSLALVTGVESGTNPRAAARNFRDSVGLTTMQWTHVASYRAALERAGVDGEAAQNALGRALRDKRGDKTVLAAARAGRRIPADRIDLMVSRYTDRYVKHRAEVIGRTEAMRAVNQGNEESYRQAIAAGTITEDQLRREWRTRLDGRERRTHLFLNGQVRGWGETWITENGQLRYPGDPAAPAKETIQCRCAILTRIRQPQRVR
ncbi:MAG: phage minor head protein [Nocardioides sp.]